MESLLAGRWTRPLVLASLLFALPLPVMAQDPPVTGPLLGVGVGNTSLGDSLPLLMSKYDEMALFSSSRDFFGFAGWRVHERAAVLIGVDVERFSEGSENPSSSRTSALTVLTTTIGTRVFLAPRSRVAPYLAASVGLVLPSWTDEQTPAPPSSGSPSTSEQRIENLQGLHLAGAVGAEWRIVPEVSLGAEWGLQATFVDTHYEGTQSAWISGSEPAEPTKVTQSVSASTVDALARLMLTFSL